jgi:phage terminase Nu1 subunit (DNA packaging protein)
LLVGISQPAVSDLLKRQVIDEKGTAADWLKSYCQNLREQAAGRAGSDGSLDLVGERARLAKEQADRIALQNLVTRGELAPVTLIEEVLAKTASRISGIFDAIPGAIRRRMPSLGSDEIDLIADEIAKGRNIVAQLNLEDILEAPEIIGADERVVDA